VTDFRVFIPTRDSTKWIGVFLDAYRKIGVEPLYIVDSRSKDGTLETLRSMNADTVLFTPSGDFAEAGMVEFGAQHIETQWALRFDDDEFPTRALIQWAADVGCKSLNQGWQISRRELFLENGNIVYSRAPNRYLNRYRPDFMHPQFRLFHTRRVRYLQQLHTMGFEEVLFFDFAPDNAFFIHCNCLLRSPAERLAKVNIYEAILPLSTLKVVDEYLPELFPAYYHAAGRDSLEEFTELFARLPMASGTMPTINDALHDTMLAAVAKQRSDILDTPRYPGIYAADQYRWLRFVPIWMLRPLGELLCTIGLTETGTMLWNYSLIWLRARPSTASDEAPCAGRSQRDLAGGRSRPGNTNGHDR
jgi:hypothetical protein